MIASSHPITQVHTLVPLYSPHWSEDKRHPGHLASRAWPLHPRVAKKFPEFFWPKIPTDLIKGPLRCESICFLKSAM